jgi:RimJ/RimL family protein N-acetyltransferase
MNIEFPTQLSTKHLTLEPLSSKQIPSLATQLFRKDGFYEKQRGLDSESKIIEYFDNFIKDNNRLCLLAKLTQHPDVFVGTSSFFEPSNPLYKVEIGFTWINPQYQKTFVNTEFKFAMMQYAFEQLKIKRVQFSVQPINHNSMQAVMRLGAKFEGILRQWRFNSVQDTGDRAIFSIIDTEWPKIKTQISLKMEST